MTARDYLADRQFLANVPGLQFSKPLGELSNSYVHRLASSIRRQEGAGVPVSRQAARGHVVTPEHGPRGGSPKLPTSARRYRGGELPKSKYARRTVQLPQAKPIKTHRYPSNAPERLDLPDGSVVDVFREDTPALLARLSSLHPDDRVILTGFDCSTRVYRLLWVNRGHGAGIKVRAILEEAPSKPRDFEDWFVLVANATDSDPSQSAVRMEHVCMWVLHVYPPTNAQLSRLQRARR